MQARDQGTTVMHHLLDSLIPGSVGQGQRTCSAGLELRREAGRGCSSPGAGNGARCAGVSTPRRPQEGCAGAAWTTERLLAHLHEPGASGAVLPGLRSGPMAGFGRKVGEGGVGLAAAGGNGQVVEA